MKKIHCIVLLLIMSLCACSKQTSAPIETYSSDKGMKIVLTASRSSSLDPWMVEIELSHAGKSTKVFQEFYAEEVSKNNVSFDWQSNTECIIQMTQRDGEIISIPVQVTE